MATKTHSGYASKKTPWYREPTMIIVICVLGTSLIFSAVTVTLAFVYQDKLVISDDDYRKLRDDAHLTKAREKSKNERNDEQ